MFKVSTSGGNTILIPKLFIKFQDGLDMIMSSDDEMKVNGLTVKLSTRLNTFIRQAVMRDIPIDRCSLCGCKVSHFRVVRTPPHTGYVLEPYGFKKTKEGTIYTQFNKDHIVPLSKYKLNTYYNYQFVCASCNFIKANHINSEEISKVINKAKEIEPERIFQVMQPGCILKGSNPKFYKNICNCVRSKLWEDSNFIRIIKDIVEKETSIEFDTILEKITKQALDK